MPSADLWTQHMDNVKVYSSNWQDYSRPMTGLGNEAKVWKQGWALRCLHTKEDLVMAVHALEVQSRLCCCRHLSSSASLLYNPVLLVKVFHNRIDRRTLSGSSYVEHTIPKWPWRLTTLQSHIVSQAVLEWPWNKSAICFFACRPTWAYFSWSILEENPLTTPWFSCFPSCEDTVATDDAKTIFSWRALLSAWGYLIFFISSNTSSF